MISVNLPHTAPSVNSFPCITGYFVNRGTVWIILIPRLDLLKRITGRFSNQYSSLFGTNGLA